MTSYVPYIFKSFKQLRQSFGLFVTELGGGMERVGSRLSDDIAYTQNLSRHKNIMTFYDNTPSIDSAFIAPNSSIIGEVQIGSYSSVWYNATLRGEMNAIRIGSYTSIGDSTVINTFSTPPMGMPGSVNIGNHCIIQNNCTIHSCIIDDDVFIGSGSVIGEGVKIEKGAIIAPNSYIPPGRLIPGGQLWSGNPVKFVKDLSEAEIYSTYVQSYNLWNLAHKHLNEKDDPELEEVVDSYLTENYFKWRSRYYDH